MRNTTRAVAILIVLGTFAGSAQQTTAPPAGGTRGEQPAGQGRGQAGRDAGQQPAAPAVPSISQRPVGGSLSYIRIGAADNNMWFGWRVAIPATAIKSLTLSDALAKSDLHALASVEASSTQITSAEVPKPFDYRLQAGERNAVVYRLRELNQQILAYRVENIGADDAARRKVFEFAKAVNAPALIVNADTPSLADLEKLGDEFNINVAVDSKGDPRSVLKLIEGLGKRIGMAADLGGWMRAGIKPVDGLALVKDRLMVVGASDRTALGSGGRDVPLGSGAGGLGEFFLAAYRAGIKPLSIVVHSAGATEADVVKGLSAFERAMWPAMAERVNRMLETPAGKIRGAELLNADVRQQSG